MTAAALLGVALASRVSAQDGAPAAPSTGASPSTSSAATNTAAGQQDKAPERDRRSAATYSRGVEEILKLVDAGVSKEIMKAFIESASIAFEVSAADIVALKQRGVSDEVTAALLKRNAEVKAAVGRVRGTIAAPAIVRALSTDGSLDPDSYEFFWYHFAYPRALSESYRMLSPYYPGYYSRFYAGRPG